MSCKKFIIASLLLLSSPFLQAELNFDDDDFLFDLGMGPVRQSCSNADIIVPPLNECKILDILKNDVFLKTSDLNARSLLDMPLFQTAFPKNDALAININFFFNKTDRKFFTTYSDRIDSYLALQDPALRAGVVDHPCRGRLCRGASEQWQPHFILA